MKKCFVGYGKRLPSCLPGSLIGLCLIFFGFSLTFAKGSFTVKDDGSIFVGGTRFGDMNEYILSDYFRENGMRCGTIRPATEIDQQKARSMNDCTGQLTRIMSEYWLSGIYVSVPVWFHVIYRSDGAGYVSDAAINAQIKVLNEDFRAMAGTLGGQGFDTRIGFTLAGITRTQNDFWFNDGDTTGYKTALNRDPSTNVNVYTNTAGGYLGYATFPQEAAGLPADGIVLNYAVVGGRSNGYQLYDQGRTLVHEMGHYLGLYHTFDEFGTCSNSYTAGDLIVDTPSENTEHNLCIQENSCGTPDPIHNYMNYTPDSCMQEFTREQTNRMVCSLVNYRPGMNNEVLTGSIVPALETLLLKQ